MRARWRRQLRRQFTKGPKQSFLGYMFYNRLWFDNDKYGLTLGGGQINNPGRYLVLLPPINGATATSGTLISRESGDPYKAWDVSGTFDWMPSQYITSAGVQHRAANVAVFFRSEALRHQAANNGAPGSLVCLSGFTTCNGSPTNTWFPDLRKTENRLNMAILVKSDLAQQNQGGPPVQVHVRGCFILLR